MEAKEVKDFIKDIEKEITNLAMKLWDLKKELEKNIGYLDDLIELESENK